jgi:hypothetical protein
VVAKTIFIISSTTWSQKDLSSPHLPCVQKETYFTSSSYYHSIAKTFFFTSLHDYQALEKFSITSFLNYMVTPY